MLNPPGKSGFLPQKYFNVEQRDTEDVGLDS
jgi:hypothetical protein